MTEQQIVSAYFTYCKLQKNLDNKTLKAYQIDLKQFLAFYTLSIGIYFALVPFPVISAPRMMNQNTSCYKNF